MKKLVIFALVATGLFMGSCSDDAQTDALPQLTQTDKNDLLTLREEEKLARDVYLYSYDKYTLDIFINISQSEQQHMDKVLSILNVYNIPDPALANRGEFANQELQDLYDTLVAQVDLSLIDALKVGATIEDLDINDIEVFENRTNNTMILDMYSKLKCGSRNHMRSYYAQLLTNDVTYVPQFISTSLLAEIISGSNEQCGRGQ